METFLQVLYYVAQSVGPFVFCASWLFVSLPVAGVLLLGLFFFTESHSLFSDVRVRFTQVRLLVN